MSEDLKRPQKETVYAEPNTQNDIQLAQRYWHRIDEGERTAMLRNLEQAVDRNGNGILYVLRNHEGVTEEDRERMAAFRDLARDNGYELGPFGIDEARPQMAAARIRKLKS